MGEHSRFISDEEAERGHYNIVNMGFRQMYLVGGNSVLHIDSMTIEGYKVSQVTRYNANMVRQFRDATNGNRRPIYGSRATDRRKIMGHVSPTEKRNYGFI